MSDLDWNAKRLIVKMLATDEDPEEIVDAVYERSLIDVDADEIRRLDPRRPEGDLSSDLARLYRQTRREYQKAREAETVFVPVLASDELADGRQTCIEVEGRSIALFRAGGSCFALDDTCTHEGGPLSDGQVRDGEVECPWHGARFELDTGRATEAPAAGGVESYSVRERDGRVEVGIPRLEDG